MTRSAEQKGERSKDWYTEEEKREPTATVTGISFICRQAGEGRHLELSEIWDQSNWKTPNTD